jgi:hypothetical protein
MKYWHLSLETLPKEEIDKVVLSEVEKAEIKEGII